ncbi:MAG: glycoside hydrolase family 3 C-terminal domain-containing protein [Anaerolineae bacterium]|nr:glycoside hydrolase family 3 C-terminal domain-containing protein [Anaerolineae bacterium]
MTIQSLTAQMTLEEKAALCTGASAWTTTPIERLGVPEMLVSDGPHGVRRQPDVHEMGAESLPATCFPTASALAATWDEVLIGEMGAALAEECIAQDVDVVLGPGANMKRSPLNGRNFEYFSEDPYLAGELAAAYINGVQSQGVGTSLKHFAANNQEFQRFTISAEIDERTLREIYLPAFEKAVKEAQPWTVMCAYNKVNGTFASEHDYLLNRILKEEWGFEGLVVSDWGAVRDRVAALKGGLDWEMPGPQARRVQEVVDAVNAGELDEAVLDESVQRILGIVAKAQQTPKGGTFDAVAHHDLARRVAADGMVLLKNDGILPLNGQQTIAVIGRSARHPHFQGGGSSHINPTQVTVPFEALQAYASDAVLAYAEGYPTDNSFRQDLINEAVAAAQSAEVALLYIALPTFKESEGYDRTDLDLTDQQIALIQAVAAVQPQTVVVLNNGAPVVMGDWIDDVAAVLEAYMMGQAGGGAIADILFGAVNPSGKLAETFPLQLEDTPAFLNWPGEAGKVRYGEGLYIGYRYYDARNVPVQFPFGHGLSYTTFAYSNARVSAETFADSDGVTVYVDVTNTGSVAGKEIVQLYVRDLEAGLVRPDKELKGFAKVSLEPGETKTVEMTLDFRAFAFYHPDYAAWITEDGNFELLIGASSADIRQTLTVTLRSTLELPCLLDEESTIREWLDDPRGKVLAEPILDQIRANVAAMFAGIMAGDSGAAENVDMDLMMGFSDMPLVSVMLWQADSFDKHPEDLVDDLLKQVYQAAQPVR